MHPILVGKRALPAVALTNDVATLTGAGRPGARDDAFANGLAALGRGQDLAMGIATGAIDPAVTRALDRARTMGMLTIALTSGRVLAEGVDFAFAVPTDDPLVVQEVHETLYHILWELVHVFLDHRTLPDAEAPSHA